jgi:adenylate cyclase
MAGAWFEEMKRRRVFRALLGYGIVSFAVLQIIEPVMHGLNLPEWVLKATVVALGLGFPFTLVLAWAFDVKGGRIEKAGAPRGRGLLLLLVLGLLIGAPGVTWYFWQTRPAPPPAADSPSIAVLPFTDLSPAKDQDWMCDGIAEEILDALCTVTGLRVAARSSSFQFKGKPADVREMARALGVSTLLEGSLRKIGDRLRVSARLVSSEGYELWSDKFDRGVSDAFAIQDEIARAVVAALRLRVTPEQARRGTTNPKAYEMYLRGLQYLHASGPDNVALARELFRGAVALDPSFAQAHAGIADADGTKLQWLLAPKESVPAMRAEALAESEEALRLEPDLAEAHLARGNVLSLLGRAEDADQSFRRATVIAPGLRDAWYYYARFLVSQGRHPDAAAAFEQAARADPDDYDSLSLVTMSYRRMGQQEKFLQAARRSVATAERVLKNNPADVRALYLSAESLILLGEKEKGRQRMEQAVAMRPHDFAVLYNAVCGFANLGELDKAVDLFDRAVDTGQGFRAWFEHDPDLDPLRPLPRFQQILARLPP